MSIFRSIKGTFKNVQDDFSEGLKSFTSVPEKQPVSGKLQHVKQAVNFDAGGDLLHRYEILWKDLYTYTEDTGKRAQVVDVDIAKLMVRYEKQSEILTKLHQEAANLPILLTQLQDITNTLAQVEEEYDKVEAGLVHLENLCEEVDYQREVRSHHNQLAVYEMKKDHEIQKYKVHLAREHAYKVQQIERKREQLLKERQTAYEEQFSSDVDFYKKHGKIERLPSTPEPEKKLDIADVEIEEDPSALDDFLASSASDLAISEQGGSTKTDANEASDEEGTSTQVDPVVTSPTPDSSEVTSPESPASNHSDSTNNMAKDIPDNSISHDDLSKDSIEPIEQNIAKSGDAEEDDETKDTKDVDTNKEENDNFDAVED